MEQKRLYTRRWSNFVLKYTVAVGIVAFLSLISTLMSNPFWSLRKGEFVVKSIKWGRESLTKPSRGYFSVEVYYIQVSNSVSEFIVSKINKKN